MKLKVILKRVLTISLAVVMVLSLSACSKKDKEYVASVQTNLNGIATESTAFTKELEGYFTSFDETSKTKILGSMTALEASYNKIKANEAPKKYADAQKLFVEGSDLALSALKIYKDEISAVTATTFNQSFVDRLAKGDEIMAKVNEKMIAATNKVQEIDSK